MEAIHSMVKDMARGIWPLSRTTVPSAMETLDAQTPWMPSEEPSEWITTRGRSGAQDPGAAVDPAAPRAGLRDGDGMETLPSPYRRR
jgi:hypothetical protein